MTGFLQRLLFAVTLIFSLVSIATADTVGPSFDCSKASTVVEEYICRAHATELHRLDRELARLYRELQDQLPSEAHNWLLASQRNWLQKRDELPDPVSQWWPLLHHYERRLEMLSHQQISYTLSRSQLPYTLTLPDGVQAQLRFTEGHITHIPHGWEVMHRSVTWMPFANIGPFLQN